MEPSYIIGHEIHTLDKIIKHVVSSMAEEDGLTLMQSWIIGFLYENAENNIFQKDVEARFRIARSTVTGILQAMEREGFLSREPVPDDARLKRLVLTEKGIAHQLTVIHNLKKLETMLRLDIDPAKLDIFMEVIRQMQHNIESNTP